LKEWNVNMKYSEAKSAILTEINTALDQIDEKQLEVFIDDILSARKVFIIGVGRVMLSLEAFAKRLCHLGIEAHCVGDITEPAISENDLLIVGSGSGCSIVPVAICKKAKEFNCKIVHIGSNPHGDLSRYSEYMIRIPVRTRLNLENEMESKQPMTSLFEQTLMILGDVLAMMIIEKQNIELEDLWIYHANLE
jgi:Predicted sugar phosphate isomerase involved in capsule formation